jgi:predicted PurR-regulated permease PerM
VARGAFFILLLSLLFAYLLEPAVTLVQRHSRLGQKDRTWAVVVVYLIGTVLLCILGYAWSPRVAAQIRSFNATSPQILQGLSSGKTAADLATRHHVTADEQPRIRDWLASHHEVVRRLFERSAAPAEYIAAKAAWLFTISILAFFILRDGRYVTDKMLKAFGRPANYRFLAPSIL